MNHFKPVYMIIAVLFTASDASALGRLFTTEQERAQLDRPQIAPIQKESKQDTVQEAATIRLNGFVKTPRQNVIWLDGAMHRPAAGQPNPVRARLAGTSQVIIQTPTLSIPLRPGQEANLQTHRIRDIIEPAEQTAETDSALEEIADD